jgi:hypothetical protein
MTGQASAVPGRRFLLLSADAEVNGVDFAEMRAGHRGRLDVHFINQVRVQGTLAGDRAPVTLTPEVAVHPVHERTAWSTDTTGRPVLQVTAELPEAPSRYTLTVHSDRLDPCFQSTAVIVPGPDGGTADRAGQQAAAPASDQVTVPIDYLAKDFASFCQALSNFSAARYPQWAERSEADFGVMLMEALSALADELSYLQDRIAAEAALGTATQRLSLVRHARLVDYEPVPALAAATVMQFDVAQPLTGVIHCQATGAQTGTVDFAAGVSLPGNTLPGPGPAMDPRWNRYTDEAGAMPALVPYLWDQDMRCLRRGATSMWIAGHGHGLHPGQRLLIDTAGAADGDPPTREIVQVTGIAERTDQVRAQDVTLIRWADGLTSDHDLTRTELAGNLRPAAQGRIAEEVFAIPGDAQPGSPVPLATVRADHGGAPVHCMFTLAGSLAWQLVPAGDGGPAQARPSLSMRALPSPPGLAADGADPAASGQAAAWQWVPSLLDADSMAPAFTVTPERYSATDTAGDLSFRDYDGEGTSIRFGDGVFGRPPVPGTTFRVHYLAGGGVMGNVGADTIVTVAPGDPAGRLVWRCTNPFAATGGADAETRAQIRDRAPQQTKAGLLSLTRPADYQAAALSYSPAVARAATRTTTAQGGWARQAAAAARWTGSWASGLTLADPVLAGPVATQLAGLTGLAELLNARRLAGSDIAVANAGYRWIDLWITCRARPAHRAGEVAAAILARLGPQQGSGGTTGFFGRDRWAFGQPLEASALTAAVQACPGVAGVTRIQYRAAAGPPSWRQLPTTLGIAAGEILRIDNDRDRPEHGLLFVTAQVPR